MAYCAAQIQKMSPSGHLPMKRRSHSATTTLSASHMRS